MLRFAAGKDEKRSFAASCLIKHTQTVRAGAATITI